MPTNPYYQATGNPPNQTRGISSLIRAESNLVQTGFDGVNTAVAAQTAALALKANIASPTFTGAPLAPTPASSATGTEIATAAFVRTAIGGGVIGAASAIRETQTATGGQTVFNLSNTYTAGAIWVYVNGVRQFPSAYTETSSNIITFSSGLSAGDSVLFEIGVITSGTAVAASAVSFSPTTALPYTDAQAAISGVLPNESGNSGKFLTTDGTARSWAAIPPAVGSVLYQFNSLGGF